jgi:uncharacterized protein (TIGR01655 family)
MKNIIIIVIVIVAVAALAILGKQYYDSRYVGKDYYTRVPLDYDMTPETLRSDRGEDVGRGKIYKLTAYNEKGEAKSVEWTVHIEDGPPQAGTFLLVKASEQIVTGWSVIKEEQIPAGALEKIKASIPTNTKNQTQPAD